MTENAMDRLLADLNGGTLVFQTEHASAEVTCNAIRSITTEQPEVRLDEGTDFVIITRDRKAEFRTLEKAHMALYSQRDPRWRNTVYAGGKTIGQAGCYVVCVAMLASLAGYDDEPPEVAAKLQEAGAFSGPLLSRPERIPHAYPRLVWDGSLNWRQAGANLVSLRHEISAGPAIIEVEFRPGGARPPQDQHFVVAERFTDDWRDLVVVDPWDGTRTQLLRRYALDNWDLGRAVYGMRLLRPGA